MKVNISENELREITSEAVKRVLREALEEGKTKKRNTDDGYLKANKAASREKEREYKGDGFKGYDKVHKSQKDYSRKGKNKNSWMDELDESLKAIGEPYRVSKILWGLDVEGSDGTATIYARKKGDFKIFLDSALNHQFDDFDKENDELNEKKK